MMMMTIYMTLCDVSRREAVLMLLLLLPLRHLAVCPRSQPLRHTQDLDVPATKCVGCKFEVDAVMNCTLAMC
jgi:hypothetical protein